DEAAAAAEAQRVADEAAAAAEEKRVADEAAAAAEAQRVADEAAAAAEEKRVADEAAAAAEEKRVADEAAAAAEAQRVADEAAAAAEAQRVADEAAAAAEAQRVADEAEAARIAEETRIADEAAAADADEDASFLPSWIKEGVQSFLDGLKRDDDTSSTEEPSPVAPTQSETTDKGTENMGIQTCSAAHQMNFGDKKGIFATLLHMFRSHNTAFITLEEGVAAAKADATVTDSLVGDVQLDLSMPILEYQTAA
ncbi:hypothetical protein, partial [Limoniibacter endophyticus]